MSIYTSLQERTREAYTDTKSITHCRGRVCVKESEIQRKAISGNISLFSKRNLDFLELSGSLVLVFYVYVSADRSDTTLLKGLFAYLFCSFNNNKKNKFSRLTSQSYCASRPLWDAEGQVFGVRRVTWWRRDESSRVCLSVRGCAVCIQSYVCLSESIR